MRKWDVVKKPSLPAVLLSVLLMLSVTACSYAKPGQDQSGQDQAGLGQTEQAQPAQEQAEQAQPAQEQAEQGQTAQAQTAQELPELPEGVTPVTWDVTPEHLMIDTPEAREFYDRVTAGEYYTIEELKESPVVQGLDALSAYYKALYGSTVDINTPEREQMRQEVLDWFLSQGSARTESVDENGKHKYVYDGPLKKEYKLELVLGLPGVHKSTMVANPDSEEMGAFILDPDMIKEQLPEYKESHGAGADAIHMEGMKLMAEAEKAFLEGDMKGTNVILPLVATDLDELLEDVIRPFEEAGYTVTARFRNGTPAESASLVFRRALGGGQNINSAVVFSFGMKPQEVYTKLSSMLNTAGEPYGQDEVIAAETADAAESSDDSATSAASDSAASEAQEASEDQTEDQTEETAPETSAMTDTVLDIVTPYYLAGGEVAQDSPEVGRDYTDHKLEHALMVRDKTLETGRALWSAIQRDNLGDEAGEGEIALGDQIDWTVLEAAALFHDTGMAGGGYAISEAVDENGETVKDDNGKAVLAKDDDGHYVMHAEDNENFNEIRTFHSMNSALYTLVNRDRLKEAGYTDGQIDRIAVLCFSHSKSNSGIRDLCSMADWKDCFDRIDSLVIAWNNDHPDQPVSFDRTVFENDAVLMGSVASEALALRVGDVSRDSEPEAEAQSGEKVYVDRDTIDDKGGSIPEEVEDADITIGENDDEVESEKSRQVHVGEQNIKYNRTFVNEEGGVTHEITVADGCSGPRCTQEAVNDHLGEFASAANEQFDVSIVFEKFEADDTEYFRSSWEDYRLEAAQNYPTVTLHYPWDQE